MRELFRSFSRSWWSLWSKSSENAVSCEVGRAAVDICGCEVEMGVTEMVLKKRW